MKAQTETLIRKIIDLETGNLTPPESNPLDKHSPHYRKDWAQMNEHAKRRFLEDLGFHRIAWMLTGLKDDYQEREKKRTIQDRLIDLWSRNRRTHANTAS